MSDPSGDEGSPDRSPEGIPVVDPADLRGGESGRSGDDSGSPTVVGVLLAAGLSTRFGERNKLLADLDGEPIVRRSARTLFGADLAAVVAVVGHQADRVMRAIRDPGTFGTAGDPSNSRASGRVAFVGNPDYAAGQSTSVRAGVRAVCGADAAVFALGDMPRVRPATVDALVAAYRAGAGDALAAAHGGRRGNPVLFDARHFPALADVAGDIGGREILLSGDRSVLVETGDPGVVRDVDTVEDLDRIR
ncbi:nucleotidyltransferase family protein [Halobacteriales archaeon QS_8_69_26]|nr:MAG: nucleotidyltransferase family protein [Halobacteriales archaeon QS_8_69_26]